MNARISHLIAIMQVAKRPPSIDKKVRTRVLAGICIVDDCGKEAVSRGCCDTHQRAFHREMDAQPTADERGNFEIWAIEQGVILSSQEVREIKANSPYKRRRGA
jgi:hypothetical protein